MKNIFYTLLLINIPLISIAQTNSRNNTGSEDSGENIKKPNVIFILTDDQRWSALGYAGNKDIQTPEMDKLAKQGTYFSNAMVTTPICSASRASIFYGFTRTYSSIYFSNR